MKGKLRGDLAPRSGASWIRLYAGEIKLWLFAVFSLQLPMFLVGWALMPADKLAYFWIITSFCLIVWTAICWHLTKPARMSLQALESYRSKQQVIQIPVGPEIADHPLYIETRQVISDLDRVFKESTVDPLTGAYNRRFLQMKLAAELDRASKSGMPLSVLFLDVNDFKKVNDTEGHIVGDVCLKELVTVAKGHIRDGDWLVRWGGDEFLIVLWNMTKNKAAGVQTRIQESLAEKTIRGKNGDFKFSVSVGVAEAKANETADQLLDRVDGELYGAKSDSKEPYANRPA